tara:strand:- start:948 stop:1685 length:738 start_codon:yes stop_codon:yes gene_type:complete
MYISFIIPCFECDKIIKNTIHKLKKKLNRIKKIKYELILIDDGSKDNTRKIIKKYTSKNIRLVINPINLGKSASLIKGINLAKNRRVVLIDCDLPYFKYLNKILVKLKSEKFIYINRKSKNSKLVNKKLNLYQISRFLIGRFICFLLNLFFLNSNIGDTQAGLKAFIKPKNFNKIKFISKKFFLDAELMILFNKSKIKMTSVPVNYKIYNNSSIKIMAFKNLLYLIELFKLIIFYRFRKVDKLKI